MNLHRAEYINRQEALDYFKNKGLPMSESTLYRRCKEGKIPTYKWGKETLFREHELKSFIIQTLHGED